MAQRLGINVPQITLYPIGGVATLSRIPCEPGQEFLITIVGPLFNFALAFLLFVPLYFWLGPENLFSPSLDNWPRTFANVFWINPILGLFNLIPAFPMDGGRLLRSILARFMSHRKASQISVNFGYFFAILFALLGFYNKNWMLVLIAGFVCWSASKELK